MDQIALVPGFRDSVDAPRDRSLLRVVGSERSTSAPDCFSRGDAPSARGVSERTLTGNGNVFDQRGKTKATGVNRANSRVRQTTAYREVLTDRQRVDERGGTR